MSGSPLLRPAASADVATVLALAAQAAAAPPPCILDRTASGWTGPARAYFSIGKYAWPDPDSPNGLPYRRIDCAVNPAAASSRYDWARLARLVEECRTLVLAEILEPDDRWLDALDLRLRTWFVDPERSMEPHLEHAAALPGVNDGMWVGIIEGACLISLVHDLEALLERRPALPPALLGTVAGVRAWFGRFARWYRTSEKGRQDAAAVNNHGLWYHLQVLTWTSFADPDDPALPAMRARLVEVMAAQIGPDGDLPHELVRENALGYVVFTLLAVAATVEDSARVSTDLLVRATPSGATVRAAFVWLAEHHATVPGVAEQGAVPGRGAVLARWAADQLPDHAAVQELADQWWPQATPSQRLRRQVGLRSWR